MEEVEITKWSPQQEAFIDWAVKGTGSCVLEAVAGAGKTSVLLHAGEMMSGGVAYVAYNKKIVDETKAKLKKRGIDWKSMQAGTAHSFGLAAFKKLVPDVRIDGNKVRTLVDEMIGDDVVLLPFKSVICQLVSLAKQSIFGIGNNADKDFNAWMGLADHHDLFNDEDRPPVARIIAEAQQALVKSNADIYVIDFDDMIYLPLLHKAPFWRHNVVMVDEAQDTNAARRALVRAMVKKGGRVIAVGDPRQAIYGFTGADANALDLIAQDFNCIRLPLTVSYRCPQSVVKFAQKWVSHIEASPDAPEGSVSETTLDEFVKRNDLNKKSAVLSRTNAPLIALAFNLFRRRIPCRIEGRDIGNSIKKLMQRWKITDLDDLEERLDNHFEKETTKLLAAKKESQLARLEDAIGTIKVVIDQCRKENKHTIADAVAHVDSIFGDDVNEVMVLSSIHKAKGREWQRVFWLDREGTCPNKWARQEWQLGQEDNLCYVAATRAMSDLIEIRVS